MQFEQLLWPPGPVSQWLRNLFNGSLVKNISSVPTNRSEFKIGTIFLLVSETVTHFLSMNISHFGRHYSDAFSRSAIEPAHVCGIVNFDPHDFCLFFWQPFTGLPEYQISVIVYWLSIRGEVLSGF